MRQFKVITPKGFTFGGKSYKQGETFGAPNKSAHVQTGLHFQQIEAVREPAREPEDPAAGRKPAK